MAKIKWILCLICGNKTRLQIRADTELKNFPLYCPKCRQESLIDAKRNKDISVYGIYTKFLHFMTKILPQRTMMNIWLKQQNL